MVQFLKRADAFLENMLGEGTQAVLLLALGLAVVLSLVYHWLSVAHPYSLDYGEAPLIDQAMRLGKGENIYRTDLSEPPFTISNYPPIYVVVLAPFVKIFGPNYWAGRMISWIASIGSAIFVAMIIFTITRDRFAALISWLLFTAFPYVIAWSSYGRVDSLALMFSLAGLFVLVRWPASWWGLIGGGSLLVAAIFTRQSFALAAPLAAFIWMCTNNWRRAFLLAALIGGLSIVIFTLITAATGGGFYFNIITANVNEFGMERLEWNLRNLRDATLVLLIIAAGSLLLAFLKIPGWALIVPYLIGASLSTLTVGKIGSSYNYFLELCAALSLAAGVVVAWARKISFGRTIYIILLILLVYQSAKLIQVTLVDHVEVLKERRGFVHELRQLENIVSRSDGNILADEYMGMATQQAWLLQLQPFEMTQIANAGVWDQQPLIDRIVNKEYSLILITYFPEYPVYTERWTPTMLSAISRVYEGHEFLAETRVYRPID